MAKTLGNGYHVPGISNRSDGPDISKQFSRKQPLNLGMELGHPLQAGSEDHSWGTGHRLAQQ